MDLCMVCSCIAIHMGLMLLVGIGMLLFVSGWVVEPPPYPLKVAFITVSIFIIASMGISMCQWASSWRRSMTRADADANATTATSVVIGATNIGTIFVLGRPLGTIDAMTDFPGPIVMGAPVGIDDIDDVN